MREPTAYNARDLARWGLLDAARREAARDRLIAAEPLPPQAVLEVLLSQWAQANGLGSQAAVQSWLAERGLAAEDLQSLVARPWRWQQWCEREGAGRLNSHFLARKAGLDQVRFWRLLCTDHELAAELHQQLREGETRFEQLAGADPVAQLERWLPDHLGDPLDLADLAAAVNLSPRRLQELCRQRHGCSPMDLLRQQRLTVLAQQLHDPARAGRSLAALMAALQLSDSASTRQAFERAYGCTPAAYRRRGAMAAQPA